MSLCHHYAQRLQHRPARGPKTIITWISGPLIDHVDAGPILVDLRKISYVLKFFKATYVYREAQNTID